MRVHLDRVRLLEPGDMVLTVVLTRTEGESRPTHVGIRLARRESTQQASLQAEVREESQSSMTAGCRIGLDVLDSLGARNSILDTFVDVTVDGAVSSHRVQWPETGAAQWLPYPTPTRKLSLTRVVR